MKFNIEFDSEGSIKIKSEKAFEESLITQPTTIKSAVDENQNQNAGPFSGVPQIEKHPTGEISRSSNMSPSISSSGGSEQQPPFHSDTFDFLKGSRREESAN